MKALAFAVVLVLAGCAANSGVVPMGGDAYMVSRQAATGFPGLGNLKAEALQEANQFCTSQQKAMEVIQTTETSPPYLLGNYPRAEVQFRCAPKSSAP